MRRTLVACVALLGLIAVLLVPGLGAAPAAAAPGDVVVQPGELAVTFVARSCPAYTDIMANRARNNIQESLRDLGKDTVYSAGQPISPSIEGPNQPNCPTPLRGWNFQLGQGYVGKTPATQYLSTVSTPYSTAITTAGPIAELDPNGVDTGRTIDGAVTIVLTPEQAARAQRGNSLWTQGGVGAQTLPASGEFGFGALRCAVDNLNGDNVEFISYPQAARHVFCYYFAVTPPPQAGSITVVKALAPGTIGTTTFPFEGNISYDKPTATASGRFSLTPTAAGSNASITFIRGAVTGAAPPWNFTELVPGGWERVGPPSCTTMLNSPVVIDPASGSVSVSLIANDNVVCTYTNQRQLTGPAFLYKQTIGDVGSFPFTIDVPPPGTDVSTTVNVTAQNTPSEVASTPGNIPGVYTATETLPTVGYGTWRLEDVLCDTGTDIVQVPVTSIGQERIASQTIPAGGSYTCLFNNVFTSDGAISVSKTSLGGTGVFQYSVVPADDPQGEQYSAVAETLAPGVAVDASFTADVAPVNLPIGSRWQVQEFLPAATAAGFWRVVSADCGAAGRADRPPDAVVEVLITAINPVVQCAFTNEFVSQGSLEVVKFTSADTALRPDDAFLAYQCDDGSSGGAAVPAGDTTATSGAVTTEGFLDCLVLETATGAAPGVTVATNATLTINGVTEDYALGDQFVVAPEDVVVVEVDNALTAPPPTPTPTPTRTPTHSSLPATGSDFDAAPVMWGAVLVIGFGLALMLGARARRAR